ncbi:MAG: calcium/sodium antiporter [Gammaproteobacteria bacterium]|nr:calcium/sodium antiporter [Gammaproteobacteria bacterium]MBU1724846.1 calcium/sodium antiporter [Gammaproteobacteria bacterium]MBU2006491.1 calcium/sodium antiporter [Gammaproteobacteria bacterium]
MLMPLLAIIAGFALLVWSADRFVEGAAASAKHFGMSPLLIGMLIVGFGTSLPEMVVSAIAAHQGNPGLALGNAYGSNITNVALILGLTALIAPIAVHSGVVRKELPLLAGIGLFSGWQLWDGELSRTDAIVLVMGFFALVGWSIFTAIRNRNDALGTEIDDELIEHPMPLKRAMFWTGVGLVLLVISSRILVWGAVSIAHELGVSDLIIGLTIVALGTSLPELAASIIAARKGEHDIALGNVLGSNMFNLLAVVGIAGVIHPLEVSLEILTRDWPVMMGLTLALFVMAYGFRGEGRINRLEGGFLLCSYLAYTGWLAYSVMV